MNQNQYVEVNGKKQFISIRGNSKDLPLLLYLHGGPGDTALPLVRHYNASLENHYTVVVWEQRGAGKSYYSFTEHERPTIQTYVDDIHCIVTYLLERFKQEKIYLVGHSWGSVLGMKFIEQYPQLVHTYIGCGQVVDMRRGAELQYEYVVNESKNRKKKRVQKRLSEIEVSYTQDRWMRDLLFTTKQTVKYGGSLYGETSYNKLVKLFLVSREYHLKDLLLRQKGTMQSIKYLWPELMKVRFTNKTVFDVPIIFMEGRHDHHVPSILVKEYYDMIKSPKQLYWFENSCHFPQWSEAEKFHKILNSLVEES